MVERWGSEDLACGEKRSLQWLEKKQKKKKKNITLLACLRVQAMAAVGVGAKGKRQQHCLMHYLSKSVPPHIFNVIQY